ncbi:CBS domain protein [Streptomyces sp. XY511]|uniref:CBS domain-containing protein n=1 Tax=Streptomyces TaxID=1883 RepID=UPI0006AF0FD3|nr:CBS domain-containing protein [Streptomyces sp. XY511]KOV02978.1 CBS domain protein [Streptomyces sp. XY511]
MSTVVEKRTVSQVMTSKVVQARPDTSFEELARLLIAHRIGGLPVVDDDDKVMGVISRKDLARQQGCLGRHDSGWHRMALTPRRPADAHAVAGPALAAGELMTSPAVTVHPEQRVADAARIMERRHVDRLPVVDEEDRLIGITTRRDLLRVFLRTDEEILADVADAVSGRAPAAHRIDGLRIDVRDGMVTMVGASEPALDTSALIRVTWRVDGVVGVVNRLTTGRESDH